MGGAEREWVDWIPIVTSAVAVLLSLGFSLSNRRIARRALKISERREARRTPQFDIYVNDSGLWVNKLKAVREYGVYLRIANPSDLQTAVVFAELHVSYLVDDHPATVKIPTVSPPQLASDINSMELPRTIRANDAISGWLIFLVPEALLGEVYIQRYDLVVHDVHGVIESVQIAVFPDTPNTA